MPILRGFSSAGLVLGLLFGSLPASVAAPPDAAAFNDLAIWDDGLSEMCYYDAVESHYGKDRRYTRVHLFNRQWMGPASGVKASSGQADAVAVFKLNIAEQIPTENYNYRYLTTVFLRRPGLEPFKLATSSQEWCGTTYKRALWREGRLELDSFSYFGGEGDASWELDGRAVPREAAFVMARAAVAGAHEASFDLLPPLRGHHGVRPDLLPAKLVVSPQSESLKVPAGRFDIRRVQRLVNGQPDGWLDVEARAPFRVVAFALDGVSGRLRFSERRAYWDGGWGSGFHPPGKAP